MWVVTPLEGKATMFGGVDVTAVSKLEVPEYATPFPGYPTATSAGVEGLEVLVKMRVCLRHPADLGVFEAKRNFMDWGDMPATDFVGMSGAGPAIQIEANGCAPQ